MLKFSAEPTEEDKEFLDPLSKEFLEGFINNTKKFRDRCIQLLDDNNKENRQHVKYMHDKAVLKRKKKLNQENKQQHHQYENQQQQHRYENQQQQQQQHRSSSQRSSKISIYNWYPTSEQKRTAEPLAEESAKKIKKSIIHPTQ